MDPQSKSDFQIGVEEWLWRLEWVRGREGRVI